MGHVDKRLEWFAGFHAVSDSTSTTVQHISDGPLAQRHLLASSPLPPPTPSIHPSIPWHPSHQLSAVLVRVCGALVGLGAVVVRCTEPVDTPNALGR